MVLILIALMHLPASSQPLGEIRRADSFRSAGNLMGAILAYTRLVQHHPKSYIPRYNLACAYAVAKQPDSAFAHLLFMYNAEYSLTEALTDVDFIPLYNESRWVALERNIVRIMERKEGFRMQDLDYARSLWRMKADDQALYGEIAEAKRLEGEKSVTAKRLWARKDSINLRNQRNLLAAIERKGFPRNSAVGREAAKAAFLVIQHADSNLQSRFLPELLTLCKSGEADWESYALMYDRLQMRKQLPQRYGSQVWKNPQTGRQEFWKLEDPARVHVWRREAGMMPLQEYAQLFGMSYP